MRLRLTPNAPEIIRSAIEHGPHTQESLAALIGVRQSSISQIVCGRRTYMDRDAGMRLAFALNLRPEQLFVMPPYTRSTDT